MTDAFAIWHKHRTKWGTHSWHMQMSIAILMVAQQHTHTCVVALSRSRSHDFALLTYVNCACVDNTHRLSECTGLSVRLGRVRGSVYILCKRVCVFGHRYTATRRERQREQTGAHTRNAHTKGNGHTQMCVKSQNGVREMSRTSVQTSEWRVN